MLFDVFDNKIVTHLHYLADNLALFRYDKYFTENFIILLMRQMLDVIKVAKRDHVLNGCEGSKNYFSIE